MWAASCTVRVGDLYLGVRSNTHEADALIRRVLSPHLVEEVEAPANYSVQIGGDETEGVGHGLDILYHSFRVVVRSRGPVRVVRGLVSYLSGHLDEHNSDLLRLKGLAFVKDGEAIVVPSTLVNRLDVIEPRFRRLGVRTVDAPFVSLDPDTGEVVVTPPSLEVDTAAIEALAVSHPASSREAPPADVGRYRVKGWAFVRPNPDAPDLTRAGAAGALARNALNLIDVGAQRGLNALAGSLQDAEVVSIRSTLREDFLPLLEDLANT